MSATKKAKAVDTAFIRRFKKLRPKARFKELSKGDQYIVTARALAVQLAETRSKIGGPVGNLTNGYRFTIRTIAVHYVKIDPATGLLTLSSVRAIKRAFSRAFKDVLGQDAQFMFAVEQQDKIGNPALPHVHAIAIVPFHPGNIGELKRKLHKVAGEEEPDTVKSQRISAWGQLHNELAPADAHFRRAAQYDTKNNSTVIYRSRALILQVHRCFDELKKHYKISI